MNREPIYAIYLTVIVILMFYIPLFLITKKKFQTKFARRRFCKGIISILSNCQVNEKCVDQVLMLHKRLAEKYSNLNEHFRSSSEILEDLIVTIDTTDSRVFKENFKIEPPVELRERIIEIYNMIKKIQPFSSISSKQGNLLNMLKHSIDIKNEGLALNSLKQLGDEIEVLEGNIIKQTSRNKVSFSISIIGVILTLFFGTVTFLQFIAQ